MQRRTVRWSVRGMLLVIAIAAVALAIPVESARRPAQAVNALYKDNATVTFRDRYSGVTNTLTAAIHRKDNLSDMLQEIWFHCSNDVIGVVLDHRTASDESCRLIADFERMEIVGHNGPRGANVNISNFDLAKLGRLAQLKSLDLSGSQISSDGLTAISTWSELSRIDFSHTKINDHGCQFIGKCRNVSELDLSGTDISDDGISYLRSLRKLRWLQFGEKSRPGDLDVTDASIEVIVGFEHLERLDLGGASLSVPALCRLSILPKLTEVDFCLRGISSRDLAIIANSLSSVALSTS